MRQVKDGNQMKNIIEVRQIVYHINRGIVSIFVGSVSKKKQMLKFTILH